jgi:2-dehydro-3-deoxygluconokinase
MAQRFLSIGECMVELSPVEGTTFSMGFAGDTFNTAWYLRRLAPAELDVAYLSAVGDDDPSLAMAQFMRDAGVTPELAIRPGGHAGLYLISLNNGERSFSYWRDTAAARSFVDDLTALPGVGAGDTAYFSGISLGILAPTARARFLDLLANARAAGVQIVFDTNLRPRLWNTPDEMRDWTMNGAAAADIALPSFDDEAEVFGDADKEATAQRYLDAGCHMVVVKDGPNDVLIAQGSERVTVTPAPAALITDTTAAGDSFNAGFLAALHAGATPADAARRGCVISAQVIGKRGALCDIDI